MRGMSDVGSNQDVARPPEPSELSGSIHGSFDPDARIGKAAPDGAGVERGDVDARGDALSDFNPDARIGAPSGDAVTFEAEPPDSREPKARAPEQASGDLRGPDGYYTSPERRKSLALSTHGEWDSSPGNSLCRPDATTEGGRAAKEELGRVGVEGIEYRDYIPDFAPVARETVTIDTMTPDIETNRAQVYQALADRWCAEGRPDKEGNPKSDWTLRDVREWKQENDLAFHECSDMHTCQFVPQTIHSYYKHYGGRSECAAKEKLEGAGTGEQQL